MWALRLCNRGRLLSVRPAPTLFDHLYASLHKAFGRSISASLPKPQTPFPRERLCMLGWLCIVQSPCAYTPGIRAGAECGAAALTKQGRLKSVAHSRCTTQRHQRLTTRIGATPKARTLWLLAKSYKQGRLCQLNRAVARCNGTNS